jgi:hypothetical protein
MIFSERTGVQQTVTRKHNLLEAMAALAASSRRP